MQAFQMQTSGVPATLCDIEIPAPGPDQIRVTIAACGLNFADLLMLKGTYQDIPDLPFTLGMEVAGQVNAIGDAVQSLRVGDRVMVLSGQGGLAEQGVFDANRAVQIPDGMSYDDAAAFPITYGTSHIALDHRARMKPGETLLVLGAAGGVGLTAVEIGKLMGATVIASARGADKLEAAHAAGADHLIASDTDDLRQTVLDLGGADVVYDPVGGDGFRQAMRACNPEARLMPIGFASGDVPQIPANHLLVKNLDVLGFYIGAYHKFRPDVLTNSLRTLLEWYDQGRITPHISHVFPLAQVGDGLELLRSRKSTGKIVITP